jgi:exonuclease III
MSAKTMRIDNGVNGALQQRRKSIAPGRSGESKATQVVSQRNPCDKRNRRHVFNCTEVGYIGTWNVRTLYAAGQLEILLHQLKDMKWSIMGLSEVRWTGAGEFDKDEYKIIYSGRADNKHQEGVAFILRKEAVKALIGYDTIGPRILKARFKTICGKATVIQVYAPTSNSTDEEIEDFYAALQNAINDTSNQDMTIIMGDLNLKLEMIGRHGREHWENLDMGRKMSEERGC